MSMRKFLFPEEFSLDDIFKGRYLIPIYQRPYSWGEQQVKQLLTDIDESYSNFKRGDSQNADDCVLFAGTTFIRMEKNVRNEYVEYTVVDGQQRITTLTLMLMTILNQLYLIGSEDDVVGDIRNYLWKKEERRNNKELRILTLGNLDRRILQELFDKLFEKEDIVEYAKSKLNEDELITEIEKNVLRNLLIINSHLIEEQNSVRTEPDDFYKYIDYIRNNIKVISIKIDTNPVKLFSIFESINSKGKPLDEIDLIKSYIFQNLSENDYSEYLEKWGKLISETCDNLYEYMLIFIRGHIYYYKNNIGLSDFKQAVVNRLKQYYDKKNIDETLKFFVDDLIKHLDVYKRLTNFTDLKKKDKVSDRSICYFRLNLLGNYKHTIPLLFKLLSLRKENIINNDMFDEIVEYAFKFILTFQTVCSRESKQTSSVFNAIQNELYNLSNSNNVNFDEKKLEKIKYIFNKKIDENCISNNILENNIINTITYNKNKNIAKFILAYLLNTSGKSVDFEKINAILELGGVIQIDHILPQKPSKDDNNFRYYQDGDSMILKDGQDFVSGSPIYKMPLADFLESYIHKFGNLRLEWKKDNIEKSNSLIKLEVFDQTFNNNACIVKRQNELVKKLLECNLLISTDNTKFSKNEHLNKQTAIESDNYPSTFFQNNHPIGFNLIDEDVWLKSKNYSVLLQEIVSKLYELDQNIFAELASEKFSLSENGRPFISNLESDFDRCFPLANNVYINTVLSSDRIIKFCYAIINKFGLENSDLKIILETKEE